MHPLGSLDEERGDRQGRFSPFRNSACSSGLRRDKQGREGDDEVDVTDDEGGEEDFMVNICSERSC